MREAHSYQLVEEDAATSHKSVADAVKEATEHEYIEMREVHAYQPIEADAGADPYQLIEATEHEYIERRVAHAYQPIEADAGANPYQLIEAVQVTFQVSGDIGVAYNSHTCVITDIREDGHGEELGVQVGWTTDRVDSTPFSDDLFKERAATGSPYSSTFTRPKQVLGAKPSWCVTLKHNLLGWNIPCTTLQPCTSCGAICLATLARHFLGVTTPLEHPDNKKEAMAIRLWREILYDVVQSAVIAWVMTKICEEYYKAKMQVRREVRCFADV